VVTCFEGRGSKLEKFQAGESLARPPFVAQAALPAAIL
jgi:hypothetical protein